MKSSKGMTPAINRAWDALSEILEEPGANDYRKLHRAAVRLTLAMGAALVTHRTVRVDDLLAAVDELEKEAQDWDDKVTQYKEDGMHADAVDCAKDARRLRRVAKRLEKAV